jgi:hypothetical protein
MKTDRLNGPGDVGMVRDRDQVPSSHLIPLGDGWQVWRLAVLRAAGMPFNLLAPLATGEEADEAAVRAADRAAVDALLADDTFCCALAWQNPKVLRDWVLAYRAGLRAGSAALPGRRRDSRQAFVARTAQRYCAKNDTIGFFGPVAWADLGGSRHGWHGDGHLLRTVVSYEVWAIWGVAAAWSADPALLPHLPVRLDPSCAVRRDGICRPHRPPLALTPDARRVVAELHPGSTAGELADRTGLTFPVLAGILTRLAADGVLRIGFRVPLDESPDLALRRQVEAIRDPALVRALIAHLDRLEAARQLLVKATTPEELTAALDEVDAALAAAAGGQMPRALAAAGPGRRTPVYLDCRRDLDAGVGPAEREALGSPLSMLLDSARWLAAAVGEMVGDALRDRYRTLAAGRGEVTLGELQFASADVLATGGPELPELVADFQQRWAEIIAAAGQPGDDAAIRIDVERAGPLSAALFPASRPPWAAARVHTPDLMLCARPDGTTQWVLGELHVALNTVESRVFRTQADDVRALVDAVARDLPGGRVVPVYPADGPLVSSRTYPPPALDPPGLFRYWSYASDDGHPSGAPSTPAAALLVTERQGELLATGPDWTAPVLECFGEFLTALVVDLFQPRPMAAEQPRLLLGDLVIARARWRTAAGRLPARAARSGDVAHRQLRGWARAAGIPRHVFVRTPLERKPFYVDFAAPLLVENLARVVRKARKQDLATPVDVVEMLPGPDQLWLKDQAGRRYTCEFRVVAVDQASTVPVLRPASGP